MYYTHIEREAKKSRSRVEARAWDESLRKVEKAINFVYRELGISNKIY